MEAELETLTFGNVINLLNEYAGKASQLYKDKLLDDGKKATGQLLNSISTKVKSNGIDYVITLEAANYFKWVEEGRKPGKFPPPDAILKWIKAKPVLPYPDKKGKLPTEKQLAYLIGRKIANEGIEAGHQLKYTVDTLNAEYIPKLQNALNKDFDLYCIKVFNAIDKMIVL